MERDISMTGKYGPTIRVDSTDTAQSLPAGALVNAAGEPSTSILISCETNDIRIAWQATPTQGATGLGHILSSGDGMKVTGRDNILNFKFISSASGVHGSLVISPEF